jgi:hypothetical protein
LVSTNRANVGNVALDSAGNVVAAGWFVGTMDLGQGPLMASTPAGSVFLAKYDCSGNLLWAKSYGAAMQNGVSIIALTTAANGAIVITGTYDNVIDFGCGPLAKGPKNGFIAMLDPSGACLWSKPPPNVTWSGVGQGIAVDAAGGVLVSGAFMGSTDFGGGTVSSTTASEMFLVRLDGAGGFTWYKHFGTYNSPFVMAHDPAGNVAFCGDASQEYPDFGGGPIAQGGVVSAAPNPPPKTTVA